MHLLIVCVFLLFGAVVAVRISVARCPCPRQSMLLVQVSVDLPVFFTFVALTFASALVWPTCGCRMVFLTAVSFQIPQAQGSCDV